MHIIYISRDGNNYEPKFNGTAAKIEVVDIPPNKVIYVSSDGINYEPKFNGTAAKIQVVDLEKKGNKILYVSKDGTTYQPNPIYNDAAANFLIDYPAAGGDKKVVYLSKDGTTYQPNPIYNDLAKNFLIELLAAPTPSIQKPDDGRDQPEKNANKDAKTWKTAQMTDDPALWKVVDDKNINVADQFHSQANAQQYIDYHRSHPNTGGVDVDVDVRAGLAVDFNSVIGQGPKPKENEHHDPMGWREEFGVEQPGPDFQVDYVVEIGPDRENEGEEVSIQYDGLPHAGDNDRPGDKILFKINKGQIQYLHQIDEDNSQKFEVGKKEGVEPGKDKFEPLQKGKRYGLRVVKRNGADGKSTEHWGYMQNLTDGGPLKEVIHVIDRGQFKGDDSSDEF